MGQTVNLLALAFGGSNPSSPTNNDSLAEVAQLVEHQPSKLRVAGSNPVFRSQVEAIMFLLVLCKFCVTFMENV